MCDAQCGMSYSHCIFNWWIIAQRHCLHIASLVYFTISLKLLGTHWPNRINWMMQMNGSNIFFILLYLLVNNMFGVWKLYFFFWSKFSEWNQGPLSYCFWSSNAPNEIMFIVNLVHSRASVINIDFNQRIFFAQKSLFEMTIYRTLNNVLDT